MMDTSMVITEIASDIKTIEGNFALYEETNFNSRANAIDFIDFHILDRIEGLLQGAAPSDELNKLKKSAEALKLEFENINIKLFEQLRKKISTGTYEKSSFREMVCQYLEVGDVNNNSKIGYDNLDLFINGLLANNIPPEASVVLKPGMVFYQQTPARIIFQLAEMIQPGRNDVLFDLGSGLGQVAILANLIRGVTAIGVEYEPAYFAYAKACAAQLNLANVKFINADARDVDYIQGTIFFMYTPFNGDILQHMLEILQKEALKRPIRLFTYGPCSLPVARQSWLNCVDASADDLYKLYEFRSL